MNAVTQWSFGPLARHRDFVRLWAAQSVSAFGSRITRTALPVIAILLVTADPVQIAILSSLAVVPEIFVGLFAGGFIDRNPKRPLLIICDVARALLVFSIPLAAWFGHLGIAQLYVVAACIGALSALFQLADSAYLPVLIGREHLVDGNAKLAATDSVAEIGGPGLAGVLIQLLSAPTTMVIDAASYVFSAVLLGGIRTAEPPAAVAHDKPSLLEDIRVGVRAGFGHPVIGPTFVAFALDDLFSGFFMALYMLYALQTLAIDVATIGIVIGLGGVGALAGAFVAATAIAAARARPRADRDARARQALAGCSSRWRACCRPTASRCCPRASWSATAAMVAFLILANSYRQSVLPLDVIARTNGVLKVMSGVLLPLGALVAGALASATSVTVAIWVGMLGGLLAIVPLLRASIFDLRAAA